MIQDNIFQELQDIHATIKTFIKERAAQQKIERRETNKCFSCVFCKEEGCQSTICSPAYENFKPKRGAQESGT